MYVKPLAQSLTLVVTHLVLTFDMQLVVKKYVGTTKSLLCENKSSIVPRFSLVDQLLILFTFPAVTSLIALR